MGNSRGEGRMNTIVPDNILMTRRDQIAALVMQAIISNDLSFYAPTGAAAEAVLYARRKKEKVI